MILHILKMDLVLFLVQSLLQAVQYLPDVKRIEDHKRKVVDILLNKTTLVVADLHNG